MQLVSGTRLGRYEIRSKIGAGGMGEVYLAQDTELERTVALKVLPADVAADQQRMNRFVQEAKAASALNHPNILTIHEIGRTDATRFIATEFIDGETLRQRMRNAPLKLGDVLDVAAQVAGALSAAHAAGIVHRDIKPENIMLRQDGIVKVLDFGLAKLTEQRVATSVDTEALTRGLMNTEPGVVMGTAVYMSPEQARGLQVDARTDIFSVGVLIYEMIAGRLPFEGSNTNEILASILSDKETAPLARYAQAVPVELERIVAKALRKSRDERYQTVKDLLLDLKALKQELEFEAKLERSAPPKARVSLATASRGQSGATIDQSVASTVQVSQAHPTSSAEYLVVGIKQHKVAAIVGLLVVAAGIVGLAAYLRARNTEVAIESIAVLPFVNQNHDPDSEYLSDGLTESIINSLTQLPKLKVIPRSSVFYYKGKGTDPLTIGKELGARAILTGRIMQRGDNLDVSVELVDLRDGKQLWGEKYSRKVSDLLSMQRDIAHEITGNLRPKLSGADERRVAKQYTQNPEAYQLYLKGRYYWYKHTPADHQRAADYFNQAIAKDPAYALAYAGLADTHGASVTGGWLSASDGYPKGMAAAQKALELDESLAEAHMSLGAIMMFYKLDWATAEREFKRAIELNPNYPLAYVLYSFLLTATGRLDEGVNMAKRGLEADPLSVSISNDVADAHYSARRFDEALNQYRKTIEIDPNRRGTYVGMGMSYQQMGKHDEAIEAYEKAIADGGRGSHVLAVLAYAYASSGRRAEAMSIRDELTTRAKEKHVSPYALAILYTGLGEKDQALEQLNKAVEERVGFFIHLKVEPLFDPLHSEPRFADLVRRLGLPQ